MLVEYYIVELFLVMKSFAPTKKASFSCPTVNYEEFSATCYADFVKHFSKEKKRKKDVSVIITQGSGKSFAEVYPTI